MRLNFLSLSQRRRERKRKKESWRHLDFFLSFFLSVKERNESSCFWGKGIEVERSQQVLDDDYLSCRRTDRRKAHFKRGRRRGRERKGEEREKERERRRKREREKEERKTRERKREEEKRRLSSYFIQLGLRRVLFPASLIVSWWKNCYSLIRSFNEEEESENQILLCKHSQTNE